MHCLPQWPASRKGSWCRRLIDLLMLVCCFDRACHRTQAIYSNMPLCRTQPMAPYCVSRDAPFTPVSSKILESRFADIAENQPEVLARHLTEAGLIEKAAGLWGKAGQRSLERSALVEASAQMTRALDQIATLAATPSLRREQ